MKKNAIIATLILGIISFLTMSSAVNGHKKRIDPSTDINTVVFKKGTLIEVAFLSINKGMENQLKADYFPKVMPIVTEYGGKPLMKMQVKNNYSEDINAQMLVFFEWPSIAKKEAFEKDPRFLKVKKIRDEALHFLQLGFFEVDEDSPVPLDAHKFYEAYGMSLNKEKGHLMQAYFAKAGPIVTEKYDVQFALSLNPVQVTIMGHHNYIPQTFGLAIWPSETLNKQFFGSDEYAKIKHLKEAALEKIDVWQGPLILK